MTSEGDDDSKVDIPTPPPKKITIDEMIDYARMYIGDLERFVEFAKERPDTCDHRPAERKAQAFRQMVSTLELVQIHEQAFIAMVRGARQPQQRKRS